jgi:2-iminobutanoate/2-iminopropanoate deaminase
MEYRFMTICFCYDPKINTTKAFMTHKFITSMLLLVTAALSGCATQSTVPIFLNSGTVLPTTLPFSEAVVVGDTVLFSGQLGNLPGTLKLAPGGMAAEAKQTMENIKTSAEAHGLKMSDLVKCTVMLADMSEWAAFNEIYRTYFTSKYPARSAFGANGLALGARVEVECIGVVPPGVKLTK